MIVAISLISCGNGQSTETGDTANTSSPSVIDDTSTVQPSGMSNDRVISTDTAAFGVNAAAADTTNK